jgi:hypothetical protein
MKPGRPPKYPTEAERLAARRRQNREAAARWAARNPGAKSARRKQLRADWRAKVAGWSAHAVRDFDHREGLALPRP